MLLTLHTKCTSQNNKEGAIIFTLKMRKLRPNEVFLNAKCREVKNQT